MLVLTRKSGQKIIIGENSSIEVVILGVKGSQVKIGISAPKEVPVHREEISILIKQNKREIGRHET